MVKYLVINQVMLLSIDNQYTVVIFYCNSRTKIVINADNIKNSEVENGQVEESEEGKSAIEKIKRKAMS